LYGPVRRGIRRFLVFLPSVALALAAIAPGPAQAQEDGGAHVLLVCNETYGACPGDSDHYTTIQGAVDAAQPGDWVLVWPGIYHEKGSATAGVMITKPGIHLRGMARNLVVVDGTNAGAARPCSSDPGLQDANGGVGRNGIEVFKANGTSVENLTVCNFLSGTGNTGNQVWFNGGDGSGTIGMTTYRGAYVTASSTFYQAGMANPAMYGLFASNASGPGIFAQAYASNMADSGFYVGACPDCNAILRYVHVQNSALGYSGTNAGGHLVIENSEWDHNRVGILPNSLANDDLPSPQDGACPGNPAQSCTLIRNNRVHDNNNPNTPASGLTATSPVGTGILLSGGRNDTVSDNLVTNQGAWGILVNDYPDTSPPSANPLYCTGGIPNTPTPFGAACYFVAFGNQVTDNRLGHNGFFRNPTNGDLGDATVAFPIDNCFTGNRTRGEDGGTPTSDPASIQDPAVLGTCGVPGQGDTGTLLSQLACDALGICPQVGTYPHSTGVVLMPIPTQPSMHDPCDGVPETDAAQAFCPDGHYAGPRGSFFGSEQEPD
jgi:Right handed beta helix region